MWELTQDGEDFIAEGGLESERRVARASNIDQLHQRVDTLESDIDYIRGVVMRIAVNTGTMEKDEAREVMGDERFRDVFGEA